MKVTGLNIIWRRRHRQKTCGTSFTFEMASIRVSLTPQENHYYSKLFQLAGPDITGNVAGRTGAQFLSTSGLPRDVLHKIWTISDNLQQGKLDQESFGVACRLVSHCQSGLQPDQNLVYREPTLLPVFEGIQKSSPTTLLNNGNKKDWDVISISDIGADNMNSIADATRAVNIANSLTKLGIDPLEFVPFQSGPELPKSSSSMDWNLPEVDRQKYLKLFEGLSKNSQGNIEGSVARKLLEKSKLNQNLLGSIWELVDSDRDGALSKTEFVHAMHLATCCKRGATLPNELPAELKATDDQSQGVFRPQTLDRVVAKFDNDVSWKYSRTYLGNEGVVDVGETEEEMRHVHELCGQVESDIARMKVELDKRRLLLNELESEKRILTDTKTQVVESRRKLNFDKLSLQRDRAKLQSEIIHLGKLVKDASSDNQILQNSVTENETEIGKILIQVATLGSQRREAVRQHNEEVEKISMEQRETANLIESFNRSNRDVDIQVESERLLREKQRIVEEMQLRPDVIPPSVSAFSNEKTNKWATRILSDNSESGNVSSKKVGFGTTFFGSP